MASYRDLHNGFAAQNILRVGMERQPLAVEIPGLKAEETLKQAKHRCCEPALRRRVTFQREFEFDDLPDAIGGEKG